MRPPIVRKLKDIKRQSKRLAADLEETMLTISAEREDDAEIEKLIATLQQQLAAEREKQKRMVDLVYDFISGESNIPKDNLAMELQCIVDENY